MKKTMAQQELLRAACKSLKVSNAELAVLLGKKRATLYAWLAPEGEAMHRTMPESSRLLLAAILAAKRKK